MKRLVYAVIILALIYASVGLSLHFKWKSDWKACKELKASKGEFVEPREVFGGIIGLAFDVSAWPMYTLANIYHFGTPFPPCSVSE
ncbi:hypothetical protein [Roseiflexus castenholzii]|jgi:hypothetical protein|nr:hypothetical protein [Roseiflexus castenholzii]